MSKKIVTLIAALTLCLQTSGCGTIFNLPAADSFGPVGPDETRRPFGGVRADADIGYDLLSDDYCRALGIYMLFVDLPMSAIGDTITLPYVLCLGPSRLPYRRASVSGALPQAPPDVPREREDSSPQRVSGLPGMPELPWVRTACATTVPEEFRARLELIRILVADLTPEAWTKALKPYVAVGRSQDEIERVLGTPIAVSIIGTPGVSIADYDQVLSFSIVYVGGRAHSISYRTKDGNLVELR